MNVERRIRDICCVTAGYPFRSQINQDSGGNVLVVQPRDIHPNEAVRLGGLVRARADAVRREHWVRSGDVLFVNRGRFEAAVFWGDTAEAVICSHSVLSLRVNAGEINPAYLALYLNSLAGQGALNRVGQTSTVPFVSRANVEELLIPVPTMERQRVLVELGMAALRFRQLSRRKAELIDSIISGEISGAEAREVQ